MSKNLEKVLNGFMTLSDKERADFVKKANDFINGDLEVQKSMRLDNKKSANLGPLNSVCPCCGR